MALGDKIDSVAGESFAVEVLASATAVNGAPSGATAGIEISGLVRDIGRMPDSVRFGVRTTAGSGTMTITLRAWLYAGGIWFAAKALNAASTAPQTAVAIPETSANAIAYTEEVDIRGAARLYLEIVSAPGGDALTKASLALDPLTGGNMDTVIEATTGGTAGNSLTIALVHSAGAANGGTLTRIGNAFTFTYKGGTTTVANFETAVTALAGADDLIAVKTGGTGADVLSATLDLLSATALAGGLDLTTVTGHVLVGR
jgi:hypothetical protein